MCVGALFLLAWLPGAASGHHKEKHADKSVQVAGTTVNGEHVFVPDELKVRMAGTVEFTNEESDGGPPHTWTVLDSDCEDAPETCTYDTGTVAPEQSAVVDLKGLPSGEYTFICRVGGPPLPPFSLLFPAHAQESGDDWVGMVGTITVGKP